MSKYNLYIKGLEYIFKLNILSEMSLWKGFQEISVQIVHGFLSS